MLSTKIYGIETIKDAIPTDLDFPEVPSFNLATGQVIMKHTNHDKKIGPYAGTNESHETNEATPSVPINAPTTVKLIKTPK